MSSPPPDPAPAVRHPITGDILDSNQEYLHAFAMVREAIA